ncbi:hypothetical protein PVAP13_9KG484700, partial [Panicum virgatum]
PSASAISVTSASRLHVFKLSGYSHAKLLLGTGEWVESAAFKAASHYWHVRVFPNGAGEECGGPDSIALYLVLACEPKADVHADFGFEQPTGRNGSPIESAMFKDFIAREELEESEYLVYKQDDCFYIWCDIIALNQPVTRLHGPGALAELLCYCNDDLCKNIHARDKTEDEAYGKPRRCLGLRRLPSHQPSEIDATTSF